MKSDCCGADMVRTTYGAFDCYEAYECNKCESLCQPVEPSSNPCGIPKLTPEQVAAIRYPILEECNRMGDSGIATLQLVDWAICYALKDLMPEET